MQTANLEIGVPGFQPQVPTSTSEFRLRAPHVSCVEHGHTVPSVQTLEKFARALGVPLYQLFYEGKERPEPPHPPKRKLTAKTTWGTTRKEIYFWTKLRGLLARMSESARRLLLHMARKMAKP